MKKLVFLEGLPGVGKSTLLKKIKEMNNNICIVEEIINPHLKSKKTVTQIDFMNNDDMKVLAGKEKFAVIDRGPISTLSYNQTRQIVDADFNYDLKTVKKWFNKYISLLGDKNVFIYYLLRKNTSYWLPCENNFDPYGCVKNQELLEYISLFNCKKYAKNLIIKAYDYSSCEEVANEIVNQFMRT